MKLVGGIRSKLLLLVIVLMLASCSSARYTRYEGVTYLAGRGPLPAWTPVWSPTNPYEILINSASYSGESAVDSLDVATGRRTSLAHVAFGSVVATCWSPDGTHIALKVDGTMDSGGHSGLWILNRKDGSMRLLSTAVPADAVWLPDGNEMAVLRVDFDPRRLVVSLVDVQTATETLLFSDSNSFLSRGASVSPDGKKLVVSIQTSSSGPSDLHLLDLTTGKSTQLTENGSSISPAWSPRGGIIAYEVTQNQSGLTIGGIHLISPDGACDIELSQFADASSPSWSPNGEELAFLGPDGIYIANLSMLLGRDVNAGLCAPK